MWGDLNILQQYNFVENKATQREIIWNVRLTSSKGPSGLMREKVSVFYFHSFLSMIKFTRKISQLKFFEVN